MKKIKQMLKKSSFICKCVGNVKFCFDSFCDFFLKQPKNLKKLKNKYIGNSCFIVATGPSLTLNDLNLIKGSYSFSCNSIVSCFEKTSWRPDFYCISDREIMKLYFQLAIDSKLDYIFLPNDFKNKRRDSYIGFNRSFAQHIKSIYYKTCKEIIYPSKKPDCFFNDATSVIFICIQIAIYMGFKTIYLLGQDCNYSGKNLHSDIAKSDYKGAIKNNVGQDMIECFENYKQFFQKKDVKIFNCTRGGSLEVFERIKLEEAIAKTKNG